MTRAQIATQELNLNYDVILSGLSMAGDDINAQDIYSLKKAMHKNRIQSKIIALFSKASKHSA